MEGRNGQNTAVSYYTQRFEVTPRGMTPIIMHPSN